MLCSYTNYGDENNRNVVINSYLLLTIVKKKLFFLVR